MADEEEKPEEEEKKKIESLYDKTESIVTRQEEANKKREEIIEREEKLFANQRLAGTAGGHIEPKKVDPEKQKAEDAAEYFKGTQLEADIKKANE